MSQIQHGKSRNHETETSTDMPSRANTEATRRRVEEAAGATSQVIDDVLSRNAVDFVQRARQHGGE